MDNAAAAHLCPGKATATPLSGGGYRGLEVDDSAHAASVNGEALELTPVEFRLLVLLSLLALSAIYFSRRKRIA